jgi:hypothetical protein
MATAGRGQYKLELDTHKRNVFVTQLHQRLVSMNSGLLTSSCTSAVLSQCLYTKLPRVYFPTGTSLG